MRENIKFALSFFYNIVRNSIKGLQINQHQIVMYKKLLPLFFLIMLFAGSISAESNITIKIHFTFKGNPLVFRDSSYITPAGDTVIIDMCKMYLTNFKLLHQHKEVYKENYSYHFINPLKHRDSIVLRNIKDNFDELEFYIGVDSLTNTMGVLTGDLDPVFAMYWAWNSGYINAKIEGTSSKCNTPQNRFEYHIGGYLAPYQSVQKVSVPLTGKEIHNNVLDLNADLSTWFTDIQLSAEPSITVPSAKAVKMAQHYASMFSIAL